MLCSCAMIDGAARTASRCFVGVAAVTSRTGLLGA
jgi:hypothetical protein